MALIQSFNSNSLVIQSKLRLKIKFYGNSKTLYSNLHCNLIVSTASTCIPLHGSILCRECIDSVNIDSIECIRDPCPVSTVSTYIVLMVWLKSPQS